MNKNWYSEWYIQNGSASKRIRIYIKIILLILIGILIIYSFLNLNLKINTHGWKIFNNNIKNILSFKNHNPNYPNFTVLNISLQLLWKTIRITILGTILGFVISFISSFVGSKHFKKKYLKILSNFIVLLLRSMPIIFIIYLSQDTFNKEASGVFVITWFTWLWCHKNMITIFNNQNSYYYQKYVEQKYSKWYSWKIQIFKRINNRIIGLFFYSFESNLRWTTILSAFGIVGIGELIINNQSFFQYSGIPLIVLLSFLIFMEIFNIFIYKYLLFYKSQINKKTFIDWKKNIKNVLFISILSLGMYQMIIMNWKIELLGLNKIWYLFQADIATWKLNNMFNPWYGIGKLFLDAIVAIIISFIIGISLAILGNNIINNLFKSIFFRCFAISIQIIPIVIVILIFNPLFMSLSSWINIIIGIYSGISLSKHLINAINKIKLSTIYQLKLKKYSKRQIIFQYIIPYIKYDLIYYSCLAFEGIIRNLIILGTFQSSFAGSRLISLKNRNNYLEFASYIWAIYIWYFVCELSFLFINYLVKRKNYVKNI